MISLSKREKDVVRLLTDGKTNSEIASELYVSVHTIKSILENIYLKTGFHSRVQVAVWACKNIFFE